MRVQGSALMHYLGAGLCTTLLEVISLPCQRGPVKGWDEVGRGKLLLSISDLDCPKEQQNTPTPLSQQHPTMVPAQTSGLSMWDPEFPRPQASRAQGQPYLLVSEAMGLGTGLAFDVCFTTEAWQS